MKNVDIKKQATIIESVRKKAYAYAKDIDIGNQLIKDISLLIDHYKNTLDNELNEKVFQSKYTIIDKDQLLKYWHFEGIPLSVRIFYYYSVLKGLFTVLQEDRTRWQEFANHMEELHAREATLIKSRMVPGWLLAGEDECLWELAMRATNIPGDFCELGAWSGRSSIIWCGVLKFLNTDKRLLIVDNWRWGKEYDIYPFMTEGRDLFAEFTENLKEFKTYYRVYNTLTEDAIDNIVASLHGKGLSLLFHDANHSYSEVFFDVESYLPLLNEDGLLIIHDYNHPDFPEVKKAIKDICKKHNNLSFEGVFNSMGILRKVAAGVMHQPKFDVGLCINMSKNRDYNGTAEKRKEQIFDASALQSLEYGFERYKSYIKHANKHDFLEVFLTDYIKNRHEKHNKSPVLEVLDIGAGTGRLTKAVLNASRNYSVPLNVTTIEPCKSAVQEIKENLREFLQEDQKYIIGATDFYSFRKQTRKLFDLILILHSSYYFEDVSMLVSSVMNMLQERGECIFVATSTDIMQNSLYQTIYRKLGDRKNEPRTFDSDGFFTFAEHIELEIIKGNYSYSKNEVSSSIMFTLEDVDKTITTLEDVDKTITTLENVDEIKAAMGNKAMVNCGPILEAMSFLWRYPVSALLTFQDDWLAMLKLHREKKEPIILNYKDIY